MQIVRTPAGLDALRGANVIRVVAMALMIYTAAFVANAYVSFTNASLRKQSYDLMMSVPHAPDAKLPAMATEFSFTGTIATGLFQNALIPLFAVSILFFLIHRIFARTPLGFTTVLAICAYSLSIVALGMIATALVQSITGSITTTFSLGVLVPSSQNLLLFSILSKIDIFMMWQYWAVATAIASYTGMQQQQRIGTATLSFIISATFIATFTFSLYSLAEQQLKSLNTMQQETVR